MYVNTYNFHLFGPQCESHEEIKFKNDKFVLQHFVRKFLQVPIKNLMLRVPADLQNNGNSYYQPVWCSIAEYVHQLGCVVFVR